MVIKVLCALCLLFLAGKMVVYHHNIIFNPFPNEYREGAMLTTTAGLVRGVNPFELNNQPQYMNDYGVFYSIVTWPFAKICGVTMVVHRAVTAFFMFACCALMFWVMRRLKTDWLLSSAAIVFFYVFSLYPGTTTPLANPSPLGLFLFLCALFVPWSRGFTYPTLVLSAVLGILGYYTKPYFLLSVPMLAVYLFCCVSKRKSIVFFGMFAVMMFLSVLWVNHTWNCYFANCFFLHMNPGHLSWGQSVRQLKEFIFLNRVVLIAPAITLAVGWFLDRHDLFKWFRERRPVSFILYCTVFSSFVLVFWLGKHEEAYLWYYFHLLSPFLLICMAHSLTRRLPWALVLVPFLVWNCWTDTARHDNVKFDFQNEDWTQVKAMIASHKDILNSPLIAPLLVELNRPVYDNGLSEYFKKGGYRETPLVEMLSKGDPRIIVRYYAFMNEMKEKIRQRKFDLVLIAFDYAPLVPGEIKDYYRMLGMVNLKTPPIMGAWNITIWVPNDK
jgi:hypothetical protein